jgi:hypothetical protein
MLEEEMVAKWKCVAEELRTIAQRVPRGPTRDKLLQRAEQLEKSASLRRRLTSGPLFT